MPVSTVKSVPRSPTIFLSAAQDSQVKVEVNGPSDCVNINSVFRYGIHVPRRGSLAPSVGHT